jgi:hypothetical protein
MRPAEWARANQVHPQPAHGWFRYGIKPDHEHRHRLARVGREDD